MGSLTHLDDGCPSEQLTRRREIIETGPSYPRRSPNSLNDLRGISLSYPCAGLSGAEALGHLELLEQPRW